MIAINSDLKFGLDHSELGLIGLVLDTVGLMLRIESDLLEFILIELDLVRSIFNRFTSNEI